IWPWLWWVPVPVLAVSSAVATWVVIDNYRGLGHATTDSTVALRKGSVLRGTDLLRREGVLGWALRRTPFPKRAGLGALVAAAAGGAGSFGRPAVGRGRARGSVAARGAVREVRRGPPAWPRPRGGRAAPVAGRPSSGGEPPTALGLSRRRWGARPSPGRACAGGSARAPSGRSRRAGGAPRRRRPPRRSSRWSPRARARRPQ